ncbi:MAG: hypothetical protein ACOYJ1_06040 [Peptococcales bacterium]|jgi:hypothetical protein
MNTFNKNRSKSSDQEFSKEFGPTGKKTAGKTKGQNTFGQNSHGTPQTGKGYDITIPTGLEPGE